MINEKNINDKKKLTKKRFWAIVVSSFIIISIGLGIPGNVFLKESFYEIDVINIYPELEPAKGVEVNLIIIAKNGFVVGYNFTITDTNRIEKTAYIRVFGFKLGTGVLPSEDILNITLGYTFLKSGTWQIISGNYIKVINVSG